MTHRRVCMEPHVEDPILNRGVPLVNGKLTSGNSGSQEGVSPSQQKFLEQGVCSVSFFPNNGDNENGLSSYEDVMKTFDKVRKWKRKSRDNISDNSCETQRKRKSEDVEWTLSDTLEAHRKKHNSGNEVPSQLEKAVADPQPHLSP